MDDISVTVFQENEQTTLVSVQMRTSLIQIDEGSQFQKFSSIGGSHYIRYLLSPSST